MPLEDEDKKFLLDIRRVNKPEEDDESNQGPNFDVDRKGRLWGEEGRHQRQYSVHFRYHHRRHRPLQKLQKRGGIDDD